MAKDPFIYQPPTEQMVDSITVIREGCRALYEMITREIPACRERSLALTNLEQVSMWANKAVVMESWKNAG